MASRPPRKAPAASAIVPLNSPRPRPPVLRAPQHPRQAGLAPMIPSGLWYGDNLDVLRRHVGDESVDLVYLDPPFNSDRAYNVLFKERSGEDSPAQLRAFADTWGWDFAAVRAYEELAMGQQAPAPLREMVAALRAFVGPTDLMAYLVMMAQRLLELHRVLKPTGSLYLHCDPTASHYLKVLLDAIFGTECFRNEIVWKRTTAHSDAKQGAYRFGRVHDVILFYAKGDAAPFNPAWTPYDPTYVASHYGRVEEGTGRRYQADNLTAAKGGGDTSYEWRGVRPPPGRYWAYSRANMERFEAEDRLVYSASGFPRYKRYLDEMPGRPTQDVWDDIAPVNSQARERLGYPTQKPLALLERIIAASSNPGDLVLDPFCGCGTAVVAAEKMGRRWLGIDVTHLAIAVMKYRLQSSFPGVAVPVGGEPVDAGGARQLWVDDPYEFQWWANSLVMAVPKDGKKKGADQGIDGVRYFVEDHSGRLKRCLVQVKGGKVGAREVRELKGTLDGRAELGLLIVQQEPTEPMHREAIGAGLYRSPAWGEFPRVQIATVADLLEGRGPQLPPVRMTMGQADRVVRPGPAQAPLPPSTREVAEAESVAVPAAFYEVVEAALDGAD